MAIDIVFDPIGFPLMRLDDMDFYIHLLPIAKIQFERFICSVNKAGYGDKWYETSIRLNPRISPSRINENNYEKAFISGILPNEAVEFAHWLGKDYKLPTYKQWRQAYRLAKTAPDIGSFIESSKIDGMSKKILDGLTAFLRDTLSLTLMNNGLVEWVRGNDEFLGLGSPRPSFYENAYDPEIDSWRPFKTSRRMPFFGFRLVRNQT